MITLNINGTDRLIKNQLSEMSIKEFEEICSILTIEQDYIERHIKIFNILGISDSDINDIEPKEFIRIAKEFNITSWTGNEFVKEITIGDRIFQSYSGTKYVLSIRDLSKIEQYIKKDRQNYIVEMLAIIYKEVGVPKDKWYDKDHLEDKISLFKDNLTADIAVPYIELIMNDVIKNIA